MGELFFINAEIMHVIIRKEWPRELLFIRQISNVGRRNESTKWRKVVVEEMLEAVLQPAVVWSRPLR